MKNFTLKLVASCLLIMPSFVYAQAVGDTAKLAQTLWTMKKKGLVLEYLDLTEAEKASFWPVYDSYCNATQYLESAYIQMTGDYIKSYKHQAIHEVETLSARMLENDLMLAKVRKQYFKKFRKVLSPLRASEFMQLDNTLRMMIRSEARKEKPALGLSQAAHSLKQTSY